MEERMDKIALAAALLMATAALAQGPGVYPAKAIRFIVPWPPGGSADMLARMLSPKLSEALAIQVVIDNRGGAAGNIGAEIAAKSPPDGYAIVFAYSGTHAINPSIYSKMPFKESDFAPIIWLTSVAQVLAVHPSLPVKSVKDLIALAKQKPDQLTYGSSGSGAINHLAGNLFEVMTGTRITHVPYKGGGPVTIALLSGEVSMRFGDPSAFMAHIAAGKVRAIAVTSNKRSLGLPDLPTIAEAGVAGYDVTNWNGVLAPAGTPREIIARLNTEYNKILAAPDMKKRLIDNGYDPVGGAPEQFGEHIRAEIAKWAPVIKMVGLRVD